MPDVPVDRKFAVLCEITRAQHFAWRDAIAELCPGADPSAVVNKMWEITGRQTAQAYLRRIDPEAPIAAQVAAGIVWSSRSMGEDAVVESGAEGRDEAHVRHLACPWNEWHRKRGLRAEDRPGCDVWFQTMADEINRALGRSPETRLRVETLSALPDGDSSCLRRLWVEDRG